MGVVCICGTICGAGTGGGEIASKGGTFSMGVEELVSEAHD